MRKILLGVIVAAVAGGGWWYVRSGGTEAAVSGDPGAAGGGVVGAGRGGRGGRGGGIMTVELAPASRAEVVDSITVVGNLIGEATVDIVPRVAGRVENVFVKLGDRVTRGQTVVKIEDNAIREQVNQVRANLEVNEATVVSRENDARVAESNMERARASFERGLLSAAGLEDAESRYNSAVSQVTVAKAQLASTAARLDELTITLQDTNVVSPVDGFVGRRNLDQGAFAGANTPILSVVDIGTVRMVANVVEKDFRRVERGAEAVVEVDAFPGEQFVGAVSRVAPVFDPATRTATMEIEVPNPGYRLKPGMYARVRLVTGRNANALTVPRAAVVDIEGRRGVYLVADDNTAQFHEVSTGLVDTERVEILSGLDEGMLVVTTGAVAIRDGERIAVAGRQGGGGAGAARGSGAGRGGRGGEGRGRGRASETPTGEADSAARGEGRRGARAGGATGQ
jgi:RND family efflux transporter MFP subunit